MSALVAASRDALVTELRRHIGAHADIVANDLLASGKVIDAATLADDVAVVRDTAFALAEGEATYAASTVRYVLRALAAVLTERAQ